MRLVHQITKTLSGTQGKPAIPVNDQQGNSISTQEKQLARWMENFEQPLNRTPPENPPENPPDILSARNDLKELKVGQDWLLNNIKARKL
ncbi:hypothetical protein ElyMa_006455800 [Elysia marginata]|uniref:Uncharacterized protein n=1 Tax=Elysia marginata TaxID=1093978 RepID=A0AAV4HXF2_9GAST|nr:hypothetical protein ElyMa_006455800 [Elysia marginata]